MTPRDLIARLEAEGVSVNLKLRLEGDAAPPAELLELLEAHRDGLVTFLARSRLPWQLERLISAAASGLLSFSLQGVPDVNGYVLAWGCVFLTGDHEEALERLWRVFHAWQEVD